MSVDFRSFASPVISEAEKTSGGSRFIAICYIYLVVGTLPAFVPVSIPLGPFSLYFSDVLAIWLIFAFGLSSDTRLGLSRARSARAVGLARILLLAFVVVVSASLVLGVFVGTDPTRALSDIRPSISALLAVLAGWQIARRIGLADVARWVAVAMLASAVFVLLAAAAGLPLQGRSELAQLYQAGGGLLGSESEATRFLTNSSFVAMLVLAAGLTCALAGWRLGVWHWAGVAAAAFLAFMAFSRYQIFGIAAAVFLGILYVLFRKTSSSIKLLRKLVTVVVVVSGVVFVLYISSPDVVGAQISTFGTRVIGGLDPSVQAVDSSANDRLEEDRYLWQSILDSPIIGNGMGFAYKPSGVGAGAFALDAGQYYAHNYYLWIWVKAGIAAPLLMLCSLLALSIELWRRAPSPARAGLLSATVAVVPTLVFSPLLNSSTNAISTGLLLGLALTVAEGRELRNETNEGLR